MPDTLIREALDRFEESQDGSDYNRTWYEEDIAFARLGEQWDERIKKQRETERRPCLTINRCPTHIRQVVNDVRQNRPSIKVSPVDSGADPETAAIIDGLCRAIQRNGPGADVATDTAIDNAVTGGFGFFTLEIDYCHEQSFDKEIRFARVPNSLAIHWDVSSTAFDASDWDYAFESELLTEDEWDRRYPKASRTAWQGDTRDEVNYWLDRDQIRIARYWQREYYTEKLCLVQDQMGNAIPMWKKDLEELQEQFGELPGMITVIAEREVERKRVKRHLLSAVEELEDPVDWPGSMIPICPVWGDEVIHDGRRYFRSMIRDARDPQKMINAWRSAETEVILTQPRTPIFVPTGGIPKHEKRKWETANTRNYAYLEYDPQAGPMPQRQQMPGIPTGMVQAGLNAVEDFKSVLGQFNASIGQRDNETSGRAIVARQREGDTAQFHFPDNLNRAIRYAGQCLVEAIPSVYGARQAINILGEDETEKVVKLAQGGGMTEDGRERLYDLTVGKYDVTIKAGPSYATQREETRETLVEIVTRLPNAAPLLGDVLIEYLDIAGSDKIAKRLRTLLPPAIQQMEAEGAPAQLQDLPPEVQAIITNGMERIQQLEQQLREGDPERQKLQLEQKKVQSDAGFKDRELKIKEADAGIRQADAAQSIVLPLVQQVQGSNAQQAQVIAASLQGMQQMVQVVSQAVAQMAAAQAAPKRVVRDEGGAVVGVETVQ